MVSYTQRKKLSKISLLLLYIHYNRRCTVRKNLLLPCLLLLLSVAFFLTSCSSGDLNNDKESLTETDSTESAISASTTIPLTPEIPYESYGGEVPHIFIHALIAYPEIKGSDGKMNYDYECINVVEFKNMLRELYANGYCLIDIHDTFEVRSDGTVSFRESVQVPMGRKPIIVTVDDVVYDYKKRNGGMVDFLCLDNKKNIITGTYQEDGSIRYADDNEFIPILEDFIKEHPDFSANGSRFTLAMTGFSGTFGYRTDADYAQEGGDWEAEIERAKAIADRLKELGYTFASHSYGHGLASKYTRASFERDLQAFQDEVEPVIGPVSVYVYPYGKPLDPTDPKYQLAKDYGFQLFCSVSDFFYQRNYENRQSIYMTRVAVDGYSLRQYGAVLAPLFDVNKVLDFENR